MPKAVLSVVAGNTPDVRGSVVDRLLRLCPSALILAVSIDDTGARYPAVQRYFSGTGAPAADGAVSGGSGDPAVILRHDLLSLGSAGARPTVILALPADLDLLPFLAELWRCRMDGSSLGFGLDSVIEVSSAAAVAWQFSASDHAVREAREQRTLRIIAVS